MKEKLYNLIAGTGIKIVSFLFPEYFAVEPLQPTDRYVEYPFVLENLPKRSSKVLDVGCSGSMFPLIIKSLGHKVYGIDIRTYKEDIEFVECDICNSIFQDNYFDVITAVSTIEHIGLKGRYGVDEYSTEEKALTEIYRILKPGGILLMTVPFGREYKETKTHRVYDSRTLDTLLVGFNYYYKIVESPESDYCLALVKATK